ncbi:MAG: hypothetical protein F4201_00460 [Nitrospira sp. SB0677_bin_15]|nr:hypothetical protein [Nitrospira sp. SB0677_bin_15]
MKTFTSVISIFVLCVGLTFTGYAANGTVSGGPFAGETAMPSIASHTAAIQQHQDKAAMLEQKIEKLEHRLDMIKNSYRDPKGLKRQSWKRLLSSWRADVQDLRERIVWHEEQIKMSKASGYQKPN